MPCVDLCHGGVTGLRRAYGPGSEGKTLQEQQSGHVQDCLMKNRSSVKLFMLKILFLGREEAHLRYEYNKLIVVSIIEIPRG